MLLRAQVHGVGQEVADAHRHPDIGLACAQSLRIVVLCSYRLIDSFPLVAKLSLSSGSDKAKMARTARRMQ